MFKSKNMEEIKIGSIVTKGFGIRLGNLRFHYGITGLVLNIQGETATILKLTGKHQWITCNVGDLYLSTSIFNSRLSLDRIKDHESRHLITLTLEERGYNITSTPINISKVSTIHNEVEYIQDVEVTRINIDPVSSMDYGCIIHCIV